MWWRRKKEQDLERELRAHLEAEAAEQNDWNAARRALGNTTRIQEEVRAAWGGRWSLDFLHDIRFAIRQLRKAPGFTAVAVLSLALGIGSNTAIFTLVDGVLLENLPVRDPRHLLLLGDGSNHGVAVGEGGSFSLYSVDLYQHLRKESVLDGLCAFQSYTAPVAVLRAGWGTSQAAQAKLISGNYFDLLGVSASVGRVIADADDSSSAAPVAVVSYRYWKEKLNADRAVVGSRVDLSELSFYR